MEGCRKAGASCLASRSRYTAAALQVSDWARQAQSTQLRSTLDRRPPRQSTTHEHPWPPAEHMQRHLPTTSIQFQHTLPLDQAYLIANRLKNGSANVGRSSSFDYRSYCTSSVCAPAERAGYSPNAPRFRPHKRQGIKCALVPAAGLSRRRAFGPFWVPFGARLLTSWFHSVFQFS